jgi:tetratricopeptide (TPR) repeat protein
MRYLLTIIFSFLGLTLFAQINTDNIYGSWVKCKVTYKDGSALPDDNILKYTYIKYVFTQPNDLNLSVVYYEKGGANQFEINNNYLIIKSLQGGLMNTFQIEAIRDTLILQEARAGADEATSLKYYFIPERAYQDAMPLKPSDIQSVILEDTIYKESPKIYATYKWGGFQHYIYEGISESISMDNRIGHLVASFTVSQSGVADSLKILEGIDANFDKRFVKVFNRAKKDWKPATLNGKYVKVQMMIELGFSTSKVVLPAYDAENKANDAYKIKEYDLAAYYYDKAIESDPRDRYAFRMRGMCRMLLGNISGACEDWNKAKSLAGDATIDALLEKYCK